MHIIHTEKMTEDKDGYPQKSVQVRDLWNELYVNLCEQMRNWAKTFLSSGWQTNF